MPAPSLRVEGLAELRRALRNVEDAEGLREVRDGLRHAADIVATEARRRVVSRSGRARGSIRASTSGNRALVIGGKSTVPYYGWLDFGTRSPVRGNPRSRGPWAGSGRGPQGGRFIYKALDVKDFEVAEAVSHAINRALDRLGF